MEKPDGRKFGKRNLIIRFIRIVYKRADRHKYRQWKSKNWTFGVAQSGTKDYRLKISSKILNLFCLYRNDMCLFRQIGRFLPHLRCVQNTQHRQYLNKNVPTFSRSILNLFFENYFSVWTLFKKDMHCLKNTFILNHESIYSIN